MAKYFFPLFLLLLSCSSSQPEIYEWRGADRSGIYPDSDLLTVWPENGPQELWTVDSLGRGYGSPVFVEDMFFITGEMDSMAVLHCFKLEGRKVWQVEGFLWLRL